MRLADTVVPVRNVVRALTEQMKRVDRRPNFCAHHNGRLSLENRDRYIAQSILTCIIDQPPLPSAGEAVDIINWAAQRRVM